MEEMDMICEIALMYAVARGITAMLDEEWDRVKVTSSLEANAVSMGALFLQQEIARIWMMEGERK
ncbi:MAG: hypothetical protein J6M47_07505 [Clostridia bacterium]|nr:hypothetical protein [Clostridia bacterium]